MQYASRNWKLQLALLVLLVSVVLLLGLTLPVPAMAAPWSNCASCHSVAIIPVDTHGPVDCQTSGCHDGSSSYPGWIEGSAGTLFSLQGTHDNSGLEDCEFCHNPSFPNVRQHTTATLDASHGLVAAQQCVSCHTADLTYIHLSCASCHTPTAPVGATCVTCHPTMTVGHGAMGSWGNADYYAWSMVNMNGTALSDVGDNPTNPGVHANYTATTAKCGICHSVHRAKADGVKLLNTTVASCAGCHKAGSTTVTSVLISWETGGPHSSGTDSGCNSRGCHLDNPHGANASQYKIFASKLVTSAVDAAIADAVDVAGSGITTADLNAEVTSTWTQGTRDAVIAGYTCNSDGCHEQSQLAVLQKGWGELREVLYPGGNVPGNQILKSGHLSVAAADAVHDSYAPVTSCISCHDQTDAATRTGYTFPHSQTAFGASNTTGRSYLWMTYAAGVGLPKTGMLSTNEKSFDGACLKCHRTTTNGIGIAPVGTITLIDTDTSSSIVSYTVDNPDGNPVTPLPAAVEAIGAVPGQTVITVPVRSDGPYTVHVEMDGDAGPEFLTYTLWVDVPGENVNQFIAY